MKIRRTVENCDEMKYKQLGSLRSIVRSIQYQLLVNSRLLSHGCYPDDITVEQAGATWTSFWVA